MLNVPMKTVLIIAISFGISGCALQENLEDRAIAVHLLLEEPGRYDGQQVVVYGFVEYGFENCTISESETGETQFIWYSPEDDCYDVSAHGDVRRGYGYVVGVYERGRGGHQGVMKFGVITNASISWDYWRVSSNQRQ